MPCYDSKYGAYPISFRVLTLRQGSTDLEHIQIIKKVGGKLTDSYLDEGKAAAHLPTLDTHVL